MIKHFRLLDIRYDNIESNISDYYVFCKNLVTDVEWKILDYKI